jgi:3-hydroxybutyryl-CoA dehydrogenase
VTTIAVVGTGNMGPGIAATFALSGFNVRLVGRSEEKLAGARSAIEQSLRVLQCDRSVLDRILTTTSLGAGVDGTDLVVEAVSEDLDTKLRLFEELDRVLGNATLLASTTSALDIDQIASRVSHPERALILHYFYPPLLIPLVEVVRGGRTSPATVAAATDLLTRTGKRPVVLTRQVPGFVGNRLLHALMHEAISLVRSGVVSAEDADAVVRNGFGLRLVLAGPLESADLVGLDLILTIHREVLPHLARPGDPDPYLAELVAGGDLGAKVGRGFYEWSEQDPDARRLEVQAGLARLLELLGHPLPGAIQESA